MKTYFDCIPCFVRQSLDAIRSITADEEVHENILREVLKMASEMDLRQSPPAMAQRIHRRIRELTGIRDPYLARKNQLNRTALDLYEVFHERVARSDSPVELALRLAIAGNIMDLGVKSNIDESHIKKSILNCLNVPFDGQVEDFQREVDAAESILYLTDNAGEIVFDRMLIEQMPLQKITVAVKGGPVINDATRHDAEMAGLVGLVEVIDNGSDAPGTILDDCSPDFLDRFTRADLIIAKGQGNYETLSESPGPLYFLLQTKCPVIARDLKCPVGTMVLKRSRASQSVNKEPKTATSQTGAGE